MPTSADVHLYPDPITSQCDRPILYADCEGFDGGERDPIAVAASQEERKQPTPGTSKGRPIAGSALNPFHQLARGTKRVLKWANRSSPDYERTSKRGYAVSQMYPRVFMPFPMWWFLF